MSSIKHEINLRCSHVFITEQDDGCWRLEPGDPYDPATVRALVSVYGTASMALAAAEDYVKASEEAGLDVRMTIDWRTRTKQGLQAVRDLTRSC